MLMGISRFEDTLAMEDTSPHPVEKFSSKRPPKWAAGDVA
jgi:hypothetical protein